MVLGKLWRRLFGKPPIYFVVQHAGWAVTWVGKYVTRELRRQYDLDAQIHPGLPEVQHSLLHFGCRSLYIPNICRRVDPSNKVVFTWFHGTEEDTRFIEALPEGSRRADLIHTSCSISRKQLIDWGAEEEKIRVVPLGVDTDLFSPISAEEKKQKRAELGIPEDAVLIGSFQKDGNGWEEGLDPKLIKGPDVFCDVMESLARDYPIYALLTGPARGYVKKRLEAAGIPFQHHYFEEFPRVADYFPLLDMYIIASRAEGGPKAILESWASGVPLVTTRVGMAPDVVRDGHNALLREIEDVEALRDAAASLIEDPARARSLRQNALQDVQRLSWPRIVPLYYERIYSELL